MDNETLMIEVEADTTGFSDALSALEKQAAGFGTTLTTALQGAIRSGKSLEDTLRGVANSLLSSVFKGGMQPLTSMLNSLGTSIFSSIGSVLPFANGGVIQSGGVITSPAHFPLNGRTGLMAEKGPEAIMPLTRNSDGQLGVATSGGSGSTVNITINTADADSFRKSESQLSGAIARAVMRGQRTL